jgi:prepilin-type N-terminal cleavage/methylation domain-containing protein
MTKKYQGFSLVELLVVISLMAILMALASVSFTAAQRRARDAKRRADISAVQKGFEQYFAQTGTYAACATMGGSTTYFPSGLPTDPRNDATAGYVYTSSCNASAYCYCALLELTGSGNANSQASSTTCSFASGGNYYCVSNLQ